MKKRGISGLIALFLLVIVSPSIPAITYSSVVETNHSMLIEQMFYFDSTTLRKQMSSSYKLFFKQWLTTRDTFPVYALIDSSSLVTILIVLLLTASAFVVGFFESIITFGLFVGFFVFVWELLYAFLDALGVIPHPKI